MQASCLRASDTKLAKKKNSWLLANRKKITLSFKKVDYTLTSYESLFIKHPNPTMLDPLQRKFH